jgi:hypothetical protein
VVRDGPQAVWEEEALQQLAILDTERMKYTPLHVCVETAFVEIQNKVGHLLISTTF